jgi:hypothetical protein
MLLLPSIVILLISLGVAEKASPWIPLIVMNVIAEQVQGIRRESSGVIDGSDRSRGSGCCKTKFSSTIVTSQNEARSLVSMYQVLALLLCCLCVRFLISRWHIFLYGF